MLYLQAQSRTQLLMGTFVTITLPQKDALYIQKAFDEFKKVEMELSNYNEEATLYRLNHNHNTKITPYLQEALRLSEKYKKESGGAFNIQIGAITKELYHFGESETLPSLERVQEVNLTKENQIDLGGMGKGFGVDKVKKLFKELQVKEGVIAASGDIYSFGESIIKVQNPFIESETLYTFKIKDKSVSTSGNYRRYVKSKTNNHLINPYTKTSEQLFASITLISSLANSAIDAYATAATVMTLESAIEFLNKFELAYILILNSKEVIISENIEEYVEMFSAQN